ncbi:MAG: carbamoyltransferase HypF [Rhodomicrobiaceae bacterium]
MSVPAQTAAYETIAVEIRVQGRVQGVGFRPAVWRIAYALHLGGEVLNDAQGVLVRLQGPPSAVMHFIERLHSEAPPLARIESIVSHPYDGRLPGMFRITESAGGAVHTEISPDAGICKACAEEVLNPFEGRYRYPFTNCTHCGPRLSIINGVPYDRAQTTMAAFDMCEACLAEYGDPANRRFHAEATACHSCGPRVSLIRLDGGTVSFDQHSMLDNVDAARSLLQKGEIVAIKGLGGYQLACDATNVAAVTRLRERKGRYAKPFALMARDLDVIRRYCRISKAEEAALMSAKAPIVLLRAGGPEHLPDPVAPGLNMLGFMLPTTPLHLLMLRNLDRPAVMTSGNVSDEPQLIADAEAMDRLGRIAAYALIHDRDIANRVDDSVVREMDGKIRLIRRARGYAPSPLRLPRGFEAAPEILAMGGELKATGCLVKDGLAILTQHQGDLENAATFADYRKTIDLYSALFDHKPRALVADQHPDYLSSKLAAERSRKDHLPLVTVQHHHAHVASCLAENGHALNAAPVLGVVLDGLGLGDDGTIWGGEFLLADYDGYERLGCLKPVAMLGGAQAAREPWRNLYAHLTAQMGWADFAMNFAKLELFAFLRDKPRATLEAMLARNLNSPLASSCGRLFDALAAAVGVCRERQFYEGQTGAELEAMADQKTLRDPGEERYPVAIPALPKTGLPYIEPLGMWRAVLGDLILAMPAPVVAARFHTWLADSIIAMTEKLALRDGQAGPRFTAVALSGGCFQNRILFEAVSRRLQAKDFSVLTHARFPANDGGLALGQAAIGAARLIRTLTQGQGTASCASEFPAAS